MKLIKLTQGQYAQVDDKDYDFLNQWKWFAVAYRGKFYAARTEYSYPDGKKTQRSIKMHRVILRLEDPNIYCDHKDQDGLNNQRLNLRQATPQQNSFNRSAEKNSSSCHKGVFFEAGRNKPWRVLIKVDGKNLPGKSFFTEEEAAKYSKELITEAHQEFAHL